MRPVFFTLHVGSREVGLHTYGVLIAVGLAAGLVLGAREARRRQLDVGVADGIRDNRKMARRAIPMRRSQVRVWMRARAELRSVLPPTIRTRPS